MSMTEKIKKFFNKKKADARFGAAGPGRRLTDDSVPSSGPQRGSAEATRQAAEAAVARLNINKRDPFLINSIKTIQAQVKRELEAEKRAQEYSAQEAAHTLPSARLMVEGVFFRCPLISDEVLTKDEWKAKVKDFLYGQLDEERGLTACLIIRSCNYNRIKVSECVEVLLRYLDNIISNPTEPKFHKIRCSNPTFVDKVVCVLGATDFLYAAGFRKEKMEHNGRLEDFWVFKESNIEDFHMLEVLRDALISENRIEIEVDRNLQVLSPSQVLTRVDFPPDFFTISPEEIKREQQARIDNVEKNLQLRTKAMREKEEVKDLKKYKFAAIRIRFPDGLYLQGTFSIYEKFSDILHFVHSNLEHPEILFTLTLPTGQKLEENEYDSTLLQLKLVPASVLIFESEDKEKAKSQEGCYIKTEVMLMVHSM